MRGGHENARQCKTGTKFKAGTTIRGGDENTRQAQE